MKSTGIDWLDKWKGADWQKLLKKGSELDDYPGSSGGFWD